MPSDQSCAMCEMIGAGPFGNVSVMPDTRDLLDLCEGVYIARQEGQLMRETELQETVLRLYRSPETLLQLTGTELKRHHD